jgi:hypothetical protein
LRSERFADTMGRVSRSRSFFCFRLGDAGGAIRARAADIARHVEMKSALTPQTLPDVGTANVIGDIKGSEHPIFLTRRRFLGQASG